ncbi:MAG: hypothetical protein ACI88C_002766, partial [Acidimicrobiales bacterium]
SEIEALRSITDVVRMGRVTRIDWSEIVMEQGSIATSPGTVHVDCTADGLERRPVRPVFDGDLITLQAVRTCQQVFSAAFIGHIEAAYDDEDLKNELATVVPHPNTDIDWLRVTLANGMNSARWRQDEDLTAWLSAARLDAFSELRGVVSEPEGEQAGLLDRLNEAAIPAVLKLQEFLATSE